ncbi:class I SAM-dependent methyltransferase [Hyphococcus luteus]|uniref:Methyltransferase type 11 n=1 Tax=Hyphococcus luteus TaxID=2058213 RepID=A0A2S7K5X9_9PROT|nr:methyltransferase domain-containing protein [Marinicaulis flavus]PQA87881.1 methyltransferase type 11 [Marinicaulis flavus]
MRTDILDFHEFYGSPLGGAAREIIAGRLSEIWGDGEGLAIAGFGYANPYLQVFTGAAARFAFAPGAQGVIRWPQGAANAAGLVSEHHWPLPDASLDRVLIVHGLEEAPQPQKLMREVWRVLKDDGRVIIVAAHRRGLWSMIDTTPFAAGRPYLKRRLEGLLRDAIFRPRFWDSALFFPPFRSGLLLRAARAWERAGARLWPGLGGVLMLEAEKDMMAPVGLVRREGAKAVRRPAIAAPQPVQRS